MHQQRRMRSKRRRRQMPPWLPLIPTALLAVLVGLYYGGTDGYYVPTESMEPTLQKDDQFRAEIWHSARVGPSRGQIWVLHNPRPGDGNGSFLVKRVVGMPGDKIAISGGRLVVNGEAQKEGYVKEAATYRYGPVKLKDDEFFVLGDNRNKSQDSHAWGPIKRQVLIGRAFVLYLPLNRFKWL
jgi:signal peptidase I